MKRTRRSGVKLFTAHVATNAKDDLHRHDDHRVSSEHVGRLLLTERRSSSKAPP
jgi:hypothetical protein